MLPNPSFSDLNPKIVDHFESYNRDNPRIFRLFQHYGGKAIFERIRWHLEVEKGEDFKINNSYISCYVRILIERDSSFKRFFEVRHSPGTVPCNPTFDEQGQGSFV